LSRGKISLATKYQKSTEYDIIKRRQNSKTQNPKEENKMKEETYTASEAINKLGLSRGMFHRKVKQGIIPKIVKPGMTHGVYPKRDIDALALSMETALDHHNRLIFSKSTPADQLEEMEIAAKIFGRGSAVPLRDRIAIQQKNDFTYYSLKVDGHVVGYVAMHNLPESTLEDVLTGRKAIEDLKAKDVLAFEKAKEFNIYHSIIAVDPTLPSHLRHLYAGIIVRYRTEMILRLLNTNYLIKNIYTVTTTREGDQLVRKLGFQKMENKSLVKGRIAYQYKIDEKAIEHLEELSGRK
jgi:predicted DNA-binding transcriptional regulator AlpA